MKCTKREVFYNSAEAEAETVRGLPPATFVLSPEDLIVARVRDIDDKVKHYGDDFYYSCNNTIRALMVALLTNSS